jgi:hypothetical protein
MQITVKLNEIILNTVPEKNSKLRRINEKSDKEILLLSTLCMVVKILGFFGQ